MEPACHGAGNCCRCMGKAFYLYALAMSRLIRLSRSFTFDIRDIKQNIFVVGALFSNSAQGNLEYFKQARK